jgi:hypothetical protein
MANASIPWHRQFATYWLVLSGRKAFNVESIKNAIAPYLREHFDSPSLWVQGSTRITPREFLSPGNVSSSYVAVVGGPFNEFTSREGDSVMTGIKAQLHVKGADASLAHLQAARAALPSLRGAIESATGGLVVRQTMRDAFGGNLAGDVGIPVTPPIPADPRNVTGVVLGMAMVATSAAIQKYGVKQ